jgi:hypothetical protein
VQSGGRGAAEPECDWGWIVPDQDSLFGRLPQLALGEGGFFAFEADAGFGSIGNGADEFGAVQIVTHKRQPIIMPRRAADPIRRDREPGLPPDLRDQPIIRPIEIISFAGDFAGFEFLDGSLGPKRNRVAEGVLIHVQKQKRRNGGGAQIGPLAKRRHRVEQRRIRRQINLPVIEEIELVSGGGHQHDTSDFRGRPKIREDQRDGFGQMRAKRIRRQRHLGKLRLPILRAANRETKQERNNETFHFAAIREVNTSP